MSGGGGDRGCKTRLLLFGPHLEGVVGCRLCGEQPRVATLRGRLELCVRRSLLAAVCSSGRVRRTGWLNCRVFSLQWKRTDQVLGCSPLLAPHL